MSKKSLCWIAAGCGVLAATVAIACYTKKVVIEKTINSFIDHFFDEDLPEEAE